MLFLRRRSRWYYVTLLYNFNGVLFLLPFSIKETNDNIFFQWESILGQLYKVYFIVERNFSSDSLKWPKYVIFQRKKLHVKFDSISLYKSNFTGWLRHSILEKRCYCLLFVLFSVIVVIVCSFYVFRLI